MKPHAYLFGTSIIFLSLLVVGGSLYLLAKEPRQGEVPVLAKLASSTSLALTEKNSEELVLPTVVTPLPNAKITSPFTITGSAVGNWFFEASFPIVLKDADGIVLATTSAVAQSDWMVTTPVPFTATLTFATATASTGVLILRKDNPSGLMENDAQIEIPVTF